METYRPRFPYLAWLIAGIAVILSSTAGIAGLMGWLPASTGSSGDIPAPGRVSISATRAMAPQVQSEVRTRGRCAECGVVVSTREIDAHDEGAGDASGGIAAGNPDELRVTAVRRYEITIRMADRSSRVINDAGLASWRPGEQVIVIGGTNASNR